MKDNRSKRSTGCVLPAAGRHASLVVLALGDQRARPGRRTCRRPARPGRRASSTSWSRSRSAAKWTRASCASPGIRWCWWPRATRIALLIGTPLGFFLGLSQALHEERSIRSSRCCGRSRRWPGCRWVWCCSSKLRSRPALFTIAICAMWPTVLNTAVGVRAIPQDYLNVAKVLKLSRTKTLFKVLLPATLPYMFTGFRLSLGIAWLVIVAAEMLTGRPASAASSGRNTTPDLRAHHPLHPHHRHGRASSSTA